MDMSSIDKKFVDVLSKTLIEVMEDAEETDATPYFTSMIIAMFAIYKGAVSEAESDADLIDFVGIVNRLVFQFAMKNGKISR